MITSHVKHSASQRSTTTNLKYTSQQHTKMVHHVVIRESFQPCLAFLCSFFVTPPVCNCLTSDYGNSLFQLFLQVLVLPNLLLLLLSDVALSWDCHIFHYCCFLLLTNHHYLSHRILALLFSNTFGGVSFGTGELLAHTC